MVIISVIKSSTQPLILSFDPLTVEVPAADMGPPGSVSYPVQASRQLHDAELVPVCNVQSPIKEQHPGSSAHPQDRHPPPEHQWVQSSLHLFQANTSLCPRPILRSLGDRPYSSCCAARLHFPSAALYFMHESVEPNSLGLGEGRSQASPQERAPIDGQSAHPAEM